MQILVKFDDLNLFMLEDDNLYRTAVPENRKRQNLEVFQQTNLTDGPRPAPVTPANVGEVTSVRHGIFVVMHHLWTNGVEFDVLDVGSHIGDFGLKAGSFIRTCGKNSRVVTFDPSEAGALVPYSIQVNRLETIVTHEMLAVSDISGLALFQYSPGYSEAGVIAAESQDTKGLAAVWLKRFSQLPLRQRLTAYFQLGMAAIKRLLHAGKINTRYSLIANSVDILEYLERQRFEKNLFVKIDIEGYDPRVIDRLLSLLPERKLFVIFEFTPQRFTTPQAAEDYLRKLAQDFVLFDLYYCPNPTRFNLISPAQIKSFVSEVSNRQQGYTDIFLLDKRSPACEQLQARLAKLAAEPDATLL